MKALKRLMAGLALATVFAGSLPAQNRGDVIVVQEIRRFTAPELEAELQDLLQDLLPGVSPDLLRRLVPVTSGVAAYRLVYHTVDVHGDPTIASGLAAVPLEYPYPLPMAVYHHGTIGSDAEAPSNLSYEAYIGFAFATDGYLAVLPDYLGFGASPGMHPYVHARSEATASVDMMRAARQAAAAGGLPLNGQVFLTGYSQGGHACVATLREIQQRHRDEFDVEFTAAGSGPYHLSGVQLGFSLSSPEYASPGYLPYLLLSYQEAYGNLYEDLSEVFQPPYDTTVPPLFDGNHTMSQIDAAIPAAWEDLLQPSFVEGVLGNPFHPAFTALRRNNLTNFAPETPLVLYYATKDEQVSYRNSLVAARYYNNTAHAPVPVRAVWLGPWSHTEAAPIALILGKRNFDALRRFE